MKLVSGDESDWTPETLALVDRAKSLGLTLAPVGKDPWGWELRRASGELIVHGNTDVIAATLKGWKEKI